MSHRHISKKLLLATSILAMSAAASAQTSPDEPEDEVVVVGTQIKGSNIAGILPVTSLDEIDIEMTGAVSGDELLASIPQLGDVTFTEGRFTGVNGARGDVGSVNLRGVGDGNTLVLLNGRRVVNHPGTQAVNQTPVVSVNSNALPVTGIKRLEVLRDGASAVYGSDAVAGVINTQLDDDYDGLQIQLQYGESEGTSLHETSGTLKWGNNFNQGKTNLSFFGNFMSRRGMPATELRNSSTEDLRVFFEGTPFEGDTQLRNTSTQTQYGEFETLAGDPLIPGVGDDDFHIQPDSFAGCLVNLPGDVCVDNGGSIDTALRLDRAAFRDIVGDTDRYNFFGFFNHEMDNGIELFAEASYYYADYSRARETAAQLSSNRIVIPASGFYNPFGQDIRIMDLRPLDAGQRFISVKNDSFRLLGGARGRLANWDWESAFLHSEATTKDSTNRISNTLFQEALGRTTADAYNPFIGGSQGANTNLPNRGNAQATIDGFLVDVSRDSSTSLTLADAKFSNPSVLSWRGGDIGAAVGIEWRHESYEDDRDDRLDGTITFTDSVTGVTNLSDVMGSSPTPDTKGDRDVFGAFIEFAVPVVNPEMDIPLVHSLDLQLAARAESYSDVGEVLKPKVAVSWFPIESFQIRAAYAEGFRAPNLEQINATAIRRVNTAREDWILCEAIARSNNTTFTADDDCDNVSVEGVRGGGPDLKPESNKNFSVGATFEPFDFITLTADWWRIEQENLVGLFSDQNEISLDYLRRLNGSSNPNVVRAAPDAGDAALFTSVGLDPSGAGEILSVNQQFSNLDLRESEGFDLGAQVTFDTGLGRFKVKANAAHIITFFQNPSAEGLELLAAEEAGTINSLVDVVGQQSFIKQNGNPDWRYTGSLRWDKGNWGAGAFYRYVGDVVDTSVNNADFDSLPVDSFRTLNLYGDYTFEGDEYGFFDNVRFRFGVRNIEDKKPPIADQFARGYFVGLHSNRGRYWYGSMRKTF
jgi:outer membrane receptor protein involved in Fe transport